MGNTEIHLDAPNLGLLEKEYLNKCIDSTYVSTFGPFVPEFENQVARFLGCENAVSVQSGTAGLHLALHELGIGKGDDVIVPVITFAATANAVVYTGAQPVFPDVDPLTWNMTPETIEPLITSRTKAIMPVHLYGNPCDMEPILDLAGKHDLFIIEDAAESLASTYQDRYTGTFGDLGVFSFNGNKIMTTGGGGMVVARDSRKISHIRFLANQAKSDENGYFHPEIGFNYRMTNLAAALGIAQMQRLGSFIDKKVLYRSIYEQMFESVDEIRLQEPTEGTDPVWWLNSVTLDLNKTKKDIAQVQSLLKEKGIPSRRIFIPLVEFPPYRDTDKDRYKNAYAVYENGLNLPSATLNDEKGIEYTAQTLIDIVTK